MTKTYTHEEIREMMEALKWCPVLPGTPMQAPWMNFARLDAIPIIRQLLEENERLEKIRLVSDASWGELHEENVKLRTIIGKSVSHDLWKLSKAIDEAAKESSDIIDREMKKVK